jgi:hypothetical protein
MRDTPSYRYMEGWHKGADQFAGWPVDPDEDFLAGYRQGTKDYHDALLKAEGRNRETST